MSDPSSFYPQSEHASLRPPYPTPTVVSNFVPPKQKLPLPPNRFNEGPRPDDALARWKGTPFSELGPMKPEPWDSLVARCGKTHSVFAIFLVNAYKEEAATYEGVVLKQDIGPCIACHTKQQDCRGGHPCRHCCNIFGLREGKSECIYPSIPLERNAPISGFVTPETHPEQYLPPKWETYADMKASELEEKTRKRNDELVVQMKEGGSLKGNEKDCNDDFEEPSNPVVNQAITSPIDNLTTSTKDLSIDYGIGQKEDAVAGEAE